MFTSAPSVLRLSKIIYFMLHFSMMIIILPYSTLDGWDSFLCSDLSNTNTTDAPFRRCATLSVSHFVRLLFRMVHNGECHLDLVHLRLELNILHLLSLNRRTVRARSMPKMKIYMSVLQRLGVAF